MKFRTHSSPPVERVVITLVVHYLFIVSSSSQTSSCQIIHFGYRVPQESVLKPGNELAFLNFQFPCLDVSGVLEYFFSVKCLK